MANLKDTLTSILAFVLVVGDAAYQFLVSIPAGDPFNWWQFVIVVVTAVIAYFTGKNGDGSKKKVPAKS